MSNASIIHSRFASGMVPGPLRSAWLVFIGVIIGACGIFALIAPVVSTLAMSMVIAITAIIAGIAQILQAFRSKGWGGMLLSLVLGILYLAGGVVFLIWPFAGAKFLTLILSWTLVTVGITEIITSLYNRPDKGWAWMLVSGVVALGLGIWLMFRLPTASLFVPGVAWGVALLSEGAALVAMAFSRRDTAVASAA
jgi:uncharacterized membrane protein HdeD (DUF308 family)